MSETLAVLRRHRTIYLALADSLCWVAAFVTLGALRYSLDSSLGAVLLRTPWVSLLVLGLVAATLHVAIGYAVRLHHGRSSIASLEEMLTLGLVGGTVGVGVTAGNLLAGRPVPGSVPVAAACGAIVALGWLPSGLPRLSGAPLSVVVPRDVRREQ